VALIDANIGLILHAVGQYSLSLQFFEKSLELNNKFFGDKSLKVALSYHLVARTQSCMGDFRGALKNEKETFSIYKSQLGPEHEKTKEADECLRHLTQQAVVMAKKLSEAFNGRGMLGMPPIQIQPPSMTNVLDLLNIINGILYVQITPAEIEKVRLELEKGHAKALKERVKNESMSVLDKSKEIEDKNDESDAKTESEESETSDNASEGSEVKIEEIESIIKGKIEARDGQEANGKSTGIEKNITSEVCSDVKSEEEEETASR